MTTPLQDYAQDHRGLLEAAGRAAGFEAPVAFDPSAFYAPLLKVARKGPLLPVDGVLVRDWDPNTRRFHAGLRVGMRRYEVEGVAFVRVVFHHNEQLNSGGLDFLAVDQKNYRRLYKIALKARSEGAAVAAEKPVLPVEQADQLWKNTIGYLEGENLQRIRRYGGRAKRGVLLTGSPGNGKTMACRWIWEACCKRRWEYRLITPDNYRAARTHQRIEDLFSVERRGIIFFDDMDLALRDRDTVGESEDQAVFLSALDGIRVHEGVVFVFTTNCALDLIDKAFKRPGRIDVVLHFRAPEAALRRQLLQRWHEDIRGNLDIERAVASTDGYSFAEIEELKNLLVMRYMDTQTWDWGWALRQFDVNRSELMARPTRHVGFGTLQDAARNGGMEESVPF
jgi:hypothetical protein